MESEIGQIRWNFQPFLTHTNIIIGNQDIGIRDTAKMAQTTPVLSLDNTLGIKRCRNGCTNKNMLVLVTGGCL